ncbi:serine hydrolase [Bradyrhizobium sp. LHD-71]|uniref:serine hydrolase n=1 Tax=Bradyrhizobium sp. LHD-71 TaxID=3072141 RepID=UPI00280CE04F|nr:serine hydrolase [Bradyrhizobium sp. LHD-71]MDQ8729456.1 serine hydrolase [Bradyrhizobium sp. LHD-71]
MRAAFMNRAMHQLRRTVRGLTSRTLTAAAVSAAVTLTSAQVTADDKPPPQVSAVPIPAGQIDQAIGQLDALADRLMAKSGIPGMAVAVVRDGRTVYAKGFGVRKAGEPGPVDADTVFQIASLSKALTGTIVAHEVGAGTVSWDTPVVKHLPWFRLKDPWVTSHVTVADFLSHRSGLPDHGGDALEDLGYNQRQVLERLRFLPLAPFRTTYAYSNFGFTAGAAAVAAASGKPWATLADDVLYKPLGMTSTSSRFADFAARTNRASGHVKVDGVYQPKYQRQPDAQSPAGGVSSSVNDLARWIAMVLQNGTFDGRQIIAAPALLPAISPQMISAHASTSDARASFYGFGFDVGVSPAGRVVIKHSGAFAMGAGTNFAIIPSAGVGIVVVTNAWPIGVAETLATEFTDLVQFGRIERDWFTAYAPMLAPFIAPVGSLVGKPKPANPAPAARLADYLGSYANDYFGKAEIIRRGDGLVLKIGPAGIAYPLTHWDGNAFTFHPSSENEPNGSISLATFKSEGRAGFGSLTIEYLNEHGMGTFVHETRCAGVHCRRNDSRQQ